MRIIKAVMRAGALMRQNSQGGGAT
jgi:hypothetical protein